MELHPSVVILLEGIPLCAETCIFSQPGTFVFLHEPPVSSSVHIGFAPLFPCFAEPFYLCLEHFRIVQLFKGVELGLLLPESGRVPDSKILQMDI